MQKHGKVWFAKDLTLWLVVGILILTAPVAFLGYLSAVNKAEQDLETQVCQLCAKLSDVLREHVWNLDDRAISEYFRGYPMPSSLVYVRVESQFGDRIGGVVLSDESLVETCRNTILHLGEDIGSVEVALSRMGLNQYRKQAARLTLILVSIMTVAIGLLTTVLVRMLLGVPLQRFSAQLRTIAAGNYDVRLPPHRYREVDAIHAEVNLMAGQIAESTARLQGEIEERVQAERALQALKDNLEHTVAHRTSQLREINLALQEESARRRRAQKEILEISNSEQRRIGQDLHDSLGQELAGIAYLAGSLEHSLNARGCAEAVLAKQLSELLRESVSHTRRVAKGLSPVELQADGLALALHGLAADTTLLYRTKCHFTGVGEAGIRNNDVATHLFHITQEAIHNAIRHGNAKEIEITLTTDDGRGSLTIHDNGGGFIPRPEDTPGMGLRTMTYRAEMVGGTLDIQSEATGTTVTVTFENGTG